MKKLRKVLLIVLIACMVIPVMHPVDVQAAVRISSTKKTMYVGESFVLKVSGTKQKTMWSSSKKSVATVTQKGKVTAKSEGTAVITAKCGKKNLKCKVTVESKFSSKDAVKKISCELLDTGKGVVAILKNNNECDVSLEAKLVYYKNGKMIDTRSDSNYGFEKGAECALFFSRPYDSNYNDVEYDDYKITLSVEKATSIESDAKKIKVNPDFGADNVTAEVINNSDKDLEYISIACVFYDESGSAIGYECHYADCKSSGSTDYLTFDFPYDENYDTIQPGDYKIYVNCAYKYNWM